MIVKKNNNIIKLYKVEPEVETSEPESETKVAEVKECKK